MQLPNILSRVSLLTSIFYNYIIKPFKKMLKKPGINAIFIGLTILVFRRFIYGSAVVASSNSSKIRPWQVA